MLTLAVHLRLFHHVHGPAIDYLGVALAAFLSWAGIPGPGEPVLIAASVVSAKHKLDVSPVLLAAWIGATIGGIVGWLFGLKAGRSLLMAPGPLQGARLRSIERGERLFRRVEVLAIVMTPSWLAGINRSHARVYLPTNVISAALLWALPIGLGAYYAGPPLLEIAQDFGTIASIVVVVVLAGVVGIEIIRRRRPGRRRPADSA